MPTYPLHFLKQLIFYGSYLVFPFLVFIFYVAYRSHKKWIYVFAGVTAVVCAVFIYSRFIEPHILVTKFTKIFFLSNQNVNEEIKVAVFSDLHRGLYTNTVSLQKIVDTVNKNSPDIVLVPGDFIYELDKKDIENVFSPLKNLQAPAYVVTGNHDVGFPGEDVTVHINAAFEKMNIHVIDNKIEKITLKNKQVYIIGISDLWQGKSDYSILQQLQKEDFVIGVTHNPDTAFVLPEPEKVDVLVAGHTHGGQIRLPFLYKYAIPTKYDFDKGLYQVTGMNVFVTPGIGMIGLPFRFLMPPRVDMLTLGFNEQPQNQVMIPKKKR